MSEFRHDWTRPEARKTCWSCSRSWSRRARPGPRAFAWGAAWRSPNDRDMPQLLAIVTAVRELGMETCMTLGMLSAGQAQQLAGAGLDYYNHNLDTSPEYYGEVITTRCYRDRLETLERVRAAGVKVYKSKKLS